MSKKEEFDQLFNGKKDQVFSVQQEDGFEDISSSEDEIEAEEMYSLFDFAKSGKYNKKTRGFWGKLHKWWKNRKTWQKSVMITAVSFVLVIAIALGVLLKVFDYNYNEIDVDELGIEGVVDKNIINIALFGIDTRDTTSFKGNSDSIMVLSLNTVTNKVKIISIMRDTLVPITNNEKTTYKKINSAYATGGPELAIKTLNTIFGLDISEYATVNFYGMVDIIDAVGGIEAELTWAEVGQHYQNQTINGCIREICDNMGDDPKQHYITKSGPQHLNGVQAVAYSRIRYVANIWGTNNDYGRTDRQRYVMEQLFNKALTLEKSQYIKLVKSLIPCSETSLSYSKIINLAFTVLLDSPVFEQTRIPQEDFLMRAPTNTGAGSVVYFDLDFAAKVMHAFIYDDIPLEKYVEENGVEKNDWYAKRYSNSNGSATRVPSSQQSVTGSQNKNSTATSTQSKPEQTGTSSQNKPISSQKPASAQSSSNDSSVTESAQGNSTPSQEQQNTVSDNTVTSDEVTSGADSVSSDKTNSASSGSGINSSSDKNTVGSEDSDKQEPAESKEENTESEDTNTGNNSNQTSPPQSQEPTESEDNLSSPQGSGN